LATQIETLKGNLKILDVIEKSKKEIDSEGNIKDKGIDGLKIRFKVAIVAQRMQNTKSPIIVTYRSMIETLSPYGSDSLSVELQDFIFTVLDYPNS
jgi:hypothetical protein